MVTVRTVTTRQEQKAFLDFPLDLYKGNPYYIPPLYGDEKKMFRKDYVYNASCDSVFFLAYRDGKPCRACRVFSNSSAEMTFCW